MKISERLKTVAGFVKENGRLADVGTDHGYVPVYLARQGRINHAIAMDINPKPLEKAEEHIKKYGLEEKIETRLSDGMEKLLPGEADQVLIAGMGGRLMARIIKDGSRILHAPDFKRIILSPQSEIILVRKVLDEEKFQIVEEHMIKEDGKYYIIIVAEPGCCDYKDEVDFFFGKRLMEAGEDIFKTYLAEKTEKMVRMKKQLEEKNTLVTAGRVKELENEIRQCNEAWKRIGEKS